MRIGATLRAVAGIALLSVMDAFIKLGAERFPVFEVAFLRFLCGAAVAGVILTALRPGLPSRETVTANALRSVLGALTATTFFFALSRLPLAETLVLSFLAPMFIALLGSLLLKERVDRRIVAALAVGFVGVLVVVSGQFETGGRERSLEGVLAALGSAVCYAFSIVLLRARAQRDPMIYIVVFQNFGPALLLAPFAASVWVPPTASDWALFALIGALGVSGHVCLTTAFARAEAARLAPIEYTALIWATILGYAMFGEVPTLTTLIGAALIIAGALATSRR